MFFSSFGISFGSGAVAVTPIAGILVYIAMAFTLILGLLIVSRTLKSGQCVTMGAAMLTFLAWLFIRMPRGIHRYNTLPEFKYTFKKYLSSVPFGNIAYSKTEPVAVYRMYMYLFYLTTFLFAFLVAKFIISLSKGKRRRVAIIISFLFLFLLEAITLLLNFYQIITCMYDYASFILITAGIILAWLLDKYKRESDKKAGGKV